MALDPLEKEQLRRKMAMRMRVFLEAGASVSCVSGHYYDEVHLCDLCQETHADELLVIKNRSGKKLKVASECLKEMIRFQVADVEDFPKWLEKISELRVAAGQRKEEAARQREEERKRLEKKVIVRKRPTNGSPSESLN